MPGSWGLPSRAASAGRNSDSSLSVVLVTGGVHGYETSGVHGALQFVDRHAAEFAGSLAGVKHQP